MTTHSHISSLKETAFPAVEHTAGSGAFARKIKRVSDKETITKQVAGLESGLIRYICIDDLNTFLITVELNPAYPAKGKKYTISFEDFVDEQTFCNKQFVAQSNNPSQVARWLLSRKSTLYSREP